MILSAITIVLIPNTAKASVTNYEIVYAAQTGIKQITVSVKAEFCAYCNPNYLSAVGDPAFPAYTMWLDGRYVAIRLKDANTGTILGEPEKLVCNPTNWPLLDNCPRIIVLDDIDLTGVKTVVVESDIYCSWCGHWSPSPKTLAIKHLKVCIDPGHGETDVGTPGWNDMISNSGPCTYCGDICKWKYQNNLVLPNEANINLDIALRLKAILEAKNIDVIMTRNSDTFVTLNQRCNIANQEMSDIFVSIHCNAQKCQCCNDCKNPYHTAKGTETYYCPGSIEGIDLATWIQSELVDSINRYDRGIKSANYYVLENTDMPAALTEVVFLTNEEDFYYITGKTSIDERSEDAIDWASDWANGPPYPAGGNEDARADKYAYWCLCFVQDAYEFGANTLIQRYGYAKEAANMLNAANNKGIPPRGAFAFYDWTGWVDLNDNGIKDEGETKNWGHVGLSLGNGQMVHAWTDGPVVVSYDGIGLDYIGWAWPPLTPSIELLPNTEFAAQGIADGIIGYFKEKGFTITDFCPVDLLVTDPDSLRICQEFNEIPGATYTEIDLDGDGDLDDQIRIPVRKIGNYEIKVIPEPGALPTDTYTLEISLFGITYVLAKNVKIQDIPNSPYIIESTENGIILPEIDETPPTTSKTIGSPKYGVNDEWVTSTTEFNLSANDDLSGVDKTYYRIWYNGVWTSLIEYTGNFTLTGEGKHYLEYYSVDNAGNVEEIHNQTHYVDDTPPAVTISTLPNMLWPPNHKMKNVLIIGCTSDGSSGIASITFTVEDEYNLVEPIITGFGQIIQMEAWRNGNDTDGRTYTITATATDNLGNVATASTVVLVPHDQGN